MDQITGTQPTDSPPRTADAGEPAAAAPAEAREAAQPGFGARGRARRRARFLRKARELAYRDLGGLVFNLHRFGQRNDALVMAKLTTIGRIDDELRTLEAALRERRPVTVLREAGITACARCAAIHSSEDRFCPNCGLSMGRHADLPIAGAPTPGVAAPAPSAPAAPAPEAPAPSMPANPAAPAPEAPAASIRPPKEAAATGAPAIPATAAPAPARSPTPPRRPAAVESPAQEASPADAAAPSSRAERSEQEEATAILRPPTTTP